MLIIGRTLSQYLPLSLRRATINCLSVCLSEYIEMRYCNTVIEEEEKESPRERTKRMCPLLLLQDDIRLLVVVIIIYR